MLKIAMSCVSRALDSGQCSELSRNPGNVIAYRVAGNFQSLEASGARMHGAIRSRNLIHDLAGTRLTPPGAVNDFNDTGVEIIGRVSSRYVLCRSKLKSRKTGSDNAIRFRRLE